jgi:hypothetical protein
MNCWLCNSELTKYQNYCEKCGFGSENKRFRKLIKITEQSRKDDDV